MMKRPQPGYYPRFQTLSQQKFWDAATREVILKRVRETPAIRFFSLEEASLMEAICRHILPQDDRDEDRRIPLVPRIDERLHENIHDGYRFETMPPDREAYRLGLRAIEKASVALHGKTFQELDTLTQDELLRQLHDVTPVIAGAFAGQMPAERFWMLLVQDCISAYYAHPWAWDEIGFGGPAYPRAYMRLEHGEAEPWESEERRYEWSAPETSVSDIFTPAAGKEEHRGGPQGGTH
jgi:hypothetical protein